ncbi:MAG: hypothetical protein Q4G57_09040, partial [Bacillota bacterium]|nr:hypothetical protein [Bacillota bacterium]
MTDEQSGCTIVYNYTESTSPVFPHPAVSAAGGFQLEEEGLFAEKGGNSYEENRQDSCGPFD